MSRAGQIQPRTRPDCRIDVARALRLRIEEGMTWDELGRVYGVGGTAVQARLAPLLRLVADPQAIKAYRQSEAELLDGARLTLLQHMMDPERLGKASVNNLAYAHRQLFDAQRLIRGLSTQNIGLKASVLSGVPRTPPGTKNPNAQGNQALT